MVKMDKENIESSDIVDTNTSRKMVLFFNDDHKELYILKSDLTEEMKDVLEKGGYKMSDKLVDENVVIANAVKTYKTYTFENYKIDPYCYYPPLTNKQKEQKVEPVRTEPKINRNQPCICGSGKKYKKCCL